MVDGWSKVACSLYLTIQRRLLPLSPLALSPARWLARSTMAKQGENEERGAFALGGIIISSAVSQQKRTEEGKREEGNIIWTPHTTHTLLLGVQTCRKR